MYTIQPEESQEAKMQISNSKNHRPMAIVRWGMITALMLALVKASVGPVAVDADNGKIAPWVMAHTAGGQTAEFLVTLTTQADLNGAASLPTKLEKGRFVYEALWRTAQATQKPILDWLTASGVEHRPYYIVNLIWVKAGREAVLALAARPEVARIDGNPVITQALPQPESLANPESPEAIELGVSYIKAPLVWSQGITGTGVVVGAQDTGYRWTHQALINQYRGWNGSTASHDYNWHDSIHSSSGLCPGDSLAPCDDHGHGTHTAGTAVGWDGGANQIGVAPGAEWIGCRNMDQGNGTPATYIECYEFFLAPYPVGGTSAQGNPALAPDVVVNSWSCPPSEGCSASSLLAAVQANRAAGIFNEHSAGNDGPGCSTVNMPSAIYDEVFSVGALNTGADTLAGFSSRGPVTVDGSGRVKPDIAAPGTSTRSATRTSDTAYTSLSGTSMAGPHVAGAVALIFSARPVLRGNVDLTEQILADSAFRLSTTSCSSSAGIYPNNLFGYGRLDAQAAVSVALTSTVPNAGFIAGLVTDANTSAAISNALVTAQELSGEVFGAMSEAGGAYAAEVLSGTYTLTVSAPGYFPATLDGVTASAGQTTTQNISLTPLIYGVGVTPSAEAQSGDPGQTLTYALTLSNTGNVSDTYTLTVSGDAFPTGAPASVGPVAASGEISVSVAVTIPLGALAGAVDTATITALSHGDPSQTGTASLTTEVLPVYQVALTPISTALTTTPGSVVTYTLTVTNSGNITDTYTATVSSTVFTTTVSSSVGPLAAGTSTSLLVTVNVPSDAISGAMEAATLTVTSQGNGSTNVNATLTTHVTFHKLYLSVIRR